MDTRSPLFQNVAAILVGVLFINPVVAMGADLALDSAAGGNASLGQAGNGVPVVNIATPSSAGLSHNRFNEYNVGQQGLILNNATGATNSTQLGGIILGNPNLSGGAAGLILNEVTGANPSNLRGYTEVAGQRAGVIVANPHGITCDGCGFINTPRVTLSTGKPIIEQGALRQFDVDGGAIRIEGAGLNASNIDRFDLITRSAQINANLHANQLNIVTGRNQVDADTLAATAKADDGSDKPALALDSSALGGMYAGAIQLIGTEQGVGVRLAGDMAASTGDIRIDANGNLSMGRTAAAGDVQVHAENIELTRDVYAGNEANLTAERQLVNREALAAGNHVALRADELDNRALIEAGVRADNSRNTQANLSVHTQKAVNAGIMAAGAKLNINAADSLDNRTGTLAAAAIRIDTQSLDNQQGRVLAGQALDLTASSVNNQRGLLQSRVSANVTVAEAMDNRTGELVAGGALSLDADTLNNSAQGLVAGMAETTIAVGSLENSAGTLSSRQRLDVVADSVSNVNGGVIATDDQLQLTAGQLNNVGGEVSAKQSLSMQVDSLGNSGGRVITSGTLNIAAESVDNSDAGLLSGWKGVEIKAATLNNRQGGTVSSREGSLHLDVSGSLNNTAEGALVSHGSQHVRVGDLNNAAGFVTSQSDVKLEVAGTLANDAGVLNSAGGLDLTAEQASNRTGYIGAVGPLNITGETLDNRDGQVTGSGALTLALTGSLLNESGRLTSSGPLLIQASRLDNKHGYLASQALLKLFGVDLLNGDDGVIAAGTGLQIDMSGQVDNSHGGNLFSQAGGLDVLAGSLNNESGSIQARDVSLEISGSLSNLKGDLVALDDLQLQAQTLDNRSGRLGGGNLSLATIGLFSNGAGLVEAGQNLTIIAGGLDNRKGAIRNVGRQGGTRIESQGLLDNRAGSIESASQNMGFQLAALQNMQGVIRHVGNGKLDLAGARIAEGGGSYITAGDLTIDVANWVHTGLVQAARLTLNVGQLTQTEEGRLLAGETFKGTGQHWSNQGLIASDGTIDLALSGQYSSDSSLYGLGATRLSAASLMLGSSGRIASGSDVGLALGSTLTNHGRITAHGDLQAAAGTLDNFGTFGAAGKVNIAAGVLRNEQGLLFSGDAMTLNVDRLTNRYADIYSLGTLEIGQPSERRSAVVENISATIEAAGHLIMRAVSFINRKDMFATHDEQTAGSMVAVCRDCKGDHHEVDYTVTEVFQGRVLEDSPSAMLQSGGSMDLSVGTLENRQSTIATAGDLFISADRLENLGSTVGETTRVRSWYSGLITDGTDERFRWNYLNPYNAAALPKQVPLDALGMFNPTSDVTTVTANGQAASAVIQAGGLVQVKVSGEFRNDVVLNQGVSNSAARSADTAVGAVVPVVVTLNPQLPPDLAQQVVNPVALPGFTLPQGENGLFRVSDQAGSGSAANTPSDQATGQSNGVVIPNASAGGHRYLIETNPALTDLRQFMSSDYMLSQLGLNPDVAQKRLGDGLYEQRLVREAIIARTGQRYLAGLSSDEAMYRYLMDNAVASKNALQLSLGVSLTAEQVAALTHDIVWMEEHEVMGEKVLVPVLNLAQAEGRLAANGALVQGRDLELITGGDLRNQGTLRASDSMSVAARNMTNSGLMQAHERIQLAAQDSIRNTLGGVIAGKDVMLSATTGDIINERSVTYYQNPANRWEQSVTVLDSAARIEAGGNLSLNAGRDLSNSGGVLQAGANANLKAGNNLTITAVEERSSTQRQQGRHQWETTQVTQHGSEVTIGQNLGMVAGNDLTVTASRVEAGGDMQLAAGNDVLINSAANEQHDQYRYRSSSKKIKQDDRSVTQQSTELIAGGSMELYAGNDLTMIASGARAESDVSIGAERDVNLLSALDESSSSFEKQKKKSFGRSKASQSERYDSTNVATQVEAGGRLLVNVGVDDGEALTVEGGRNVNIVGSQLTAGSDLAVGALNDIAVVSGIEEHGAYAKKSKSGFLGLSKSGKSKLETQATQVSSELNADNDLLLLAGNDVRLRASNATAGNDTEIRAGLVTDNGDINLVSAQDSAYSLQESYRSKVGLSSSGNSVSIASARKAGQEAMSTTAVGSQVAAERDALLQAERDINVEGSRIVAGRSMTLDAGRDVNVVAATNSSSDSQWERKSQVGFSWGSDSNSVSVFAGKEGEELREAVVTTTASASELLAGSDVNVSAGRDINHIGSDVEAGRDIRMRAQENITIAAAQESSVNDYYRASSQQGIGVSVNHNFGSTRDAVGNAGQGDNNTSKGSGVLRAVDGVGQFLAGPTADARIGSSKESIRQQQAVQSTRGSSLAAGNDVELTAGNAVAVNGSRVSVGRDIAVRGTDVTFGTADGQFAQQTEQEQSWAGVRGGTTGGLRAGIGYSQGQAEQEGVQQISSVSELRAGRDINLEATNDLTLVGTQAQAGRHIDLTAGNDLQVRSAQNTSTADTDRRSSGLEVGATFGTGGMGLYASGNAGKGFSEREDITHQEAYLYAGDRLSFASGRDTTIAGAQLSGEEVIGRVGRDLTVASPVNTGKADGREQDVSATVTIGYGSGVSGSVGKGRTSGSTHWVENYTSITARDRLDIRTEEHTQLDGALIASETGNLTLDTGSLGFTDIQGHDRESSHYASVGISYGLGDGNVQQDPTQVGKGPTGANGWSVDGYKYERDREQTVRATVGVGEIIVRDDAATGEDSTAGLNRDVERAYEITRDEGETTELYVTESSINRTLAAVDRVHNEIQAQRVNMDQVPAGAVAALGEEQALAFAKNLVRRGLSPADLEKLSPEALTNLSHWAETASKLNDPHSKEAEGAGSASTDTAPAYKDSNGITVLPAITVTHVATPGEAFLMASNDLRVYINTLPVEQAQIALIGVQALLGPAKAAVSIAGNVVLGTLFGGEIDALKERAAVGMTAGLSGESTAVVREHHEYAKEQHAQGNVYYDDGNGDHYVLGSAFIIDIASGSIGVPGRRGGTTVAVEGKGATEPTRFIVGVKVEDQKTGQLLQGTVDLGPTLDRIKSGGSFPHRNDGSIFQNRDGGLPRKPAGYYTEYVHPTPGVSGPGPQRIVMGKGGEMYYTADHYKTFIPIGE